MFNTFSGFPLIPKPGNWSILKRHLLENMCGGDQSYYEYLITWMADIFCHPSQKRGVALVITGLKGTGKSIVFDYLRKALGRYSVKVTQPKAIVGSFNKHLENKLLLVADEAVCSTDGSVDGIIKDMITSKDSLIEAKGRDSYAVNSFMRLVFISNNQHVVNVTKDERRFFALQCGEGNIQDHAFFAEMDKQMSDGGLEAMVRDLMHHQPEAGWDSLLKAPVTPYLRQQQAFILRVLDQFILDVVREGGYEMADDALITLGENTATEVNAFDLRIAARRYVSLMPPHERPKPSIDALCEAAGRMIDAQALKRRLPGNENNTPFLLMPPLKQAREFAWSKHGTDFADLPIMEGIESDNVVPLRRQSQ